MIETIEFNGKLYPKFQASGNAARFVIPFALEVCKGQGLDIGYGKLEWKFPDAIGIDFGGKHHAMNLPEFQWDYIFSSHCLEHIKEPYYKVLNYWARYLRPEGTLFLYLPHPDQEYWWPINDTKHLHVLWPEEILKYLHESQYWTKIFVSERDLNHSFVAMAQKL
ncbi:MAG: methyltransferase domain-containing protein [Parachlamydiales bacterium]|jgi:SAM-dependent methyltransferase